MHMRLEILTEKLQRAAEGLYCARSQCTERTSRREQAHVLLEDLQVFLLAVALLQEIGRASCRERV
jgi:hypothetical protein